MPRLASVLTAIDFPSPELDALRLDGEVYRLDGCSVPIDIVDSRALRAAAVRAILPGRLIAEQHTAAWVWGALGRPPRRHEACTAIDSRLRPTLSLVLLVREVVLDAADVVSVGGLALTTPIRTAVDLARFVPEWNDVEADTIEALMRLGGFGLRECEVLMNRRRNLPGKVTALARLRSVGIATDGGS
jgi:hypothetical protein